MGINRYRFLNHDHFLSLRYETADFTYRIPPAYAQLRDCSFIGRICREYNTSPQRWNFCLHPPESELVFNRELSHNDGLLVESYMRTDNISFENAKKINDAVRQIMNQLRTERFVDLGDLGSFRMVDDLRFVYQSNPFVRPEYFGLSRASLQPIIQLQTADPQEQ